MGTNLFVEGHPHPVVLTVRLSRDVTDFKALKEVSYALASIEGFLQRDWPKLWPAFGRRRYRDIRLLHFRISSPPEFQVFADPAWLAVFITFLCGYKHLKENVREMSEDIGQIISRINGFTEREIELLAIAVRLTLQKILETAEHDIKKIAEPFNKIKARLSGESEKPLKIEVVDVDKDKHW